MAFIKNISSVSTTDDELVLAYRTKGDPSVLGELYQRYMELVYGVCLKYLEDPENAKDSVMAIYEELIIKLRRHEVTYFKGWLYQLARNHCLMILRSGKGMKKAGMDISLMQSEETMHLNGVLEREEDFRRMYICLEKLVPEQKHAVELFYLKSKCYNEIAEATGIEWNKVKSFIQNGRRNLKICMDKQMKDEA